VPHPLTLNGHLQAIIYMMMEVVLTKIRFPLKYDRELFLLSDGGTIALDWNIDDQGGRP
jgi:predicted alpha/beta-fold hydrolase